MRAAGRRGPAGWRFLLLTAAVLLGGLSCWSALRTHRASCLPVIPAKAGIRGFTAAGLRSLWIPAFAGMTTWEGAANRWVQNSWRRTVRAASDAANRSMPIPVPAASPTCC